MTLQQLAPWGRRFALAAVALGAAVGAAALGAIVHAYTRPLTPKGTPPS